MRQDARIAGIRNRRLRRTLLHASLFAMVTLNQCAVVAWMRSYGTRPEWDMDPSRFSIVSCRGRIGLSFPLSGSGRFRYEECTLLFTRHNSPLGFALYAGGAGPLNNFMPVVFIMIPWALVMLCCLGMLWWVVRRDGPVNWWPLRWRRPERRGFEPIMLPAATVKRVDDHGADASLRYPDFR